MGDYQINNLTPTIGAEISGIDLSKDLNSQNLDNIYKNLIDHKVIFFRNQNLKPEDHIALLRASVILNLHILSIHMLKIFLRLLY